MTSKVVKYNPSFLDDQELIASFVVRQASLEILLNVIRDNTQENNQHLLVIGPRGSGKTTLLRRVAVEIHRNAELDAQWFPLPFGEESYEVASAGEFWLEAIFHLGVQTGDSEWNRTYEELRQEKDEERLRQRCLARLLDFADSTGKRLVLIVENLNLMLGEQLSEDDAWALRDRLMHDPRLMLLGSATNRFDAITKPNQAMFELFRLVELERLSIGECQLVWKRVAEQEITEDQARAVQILTGGNPRLLTILALFGAKRSFRSLLEDLSLLVDEHTDYFKSNFENLPPAERKIFACLATLWEDSPTSAVADAARMTTSKASALLKRLEGRGAVRAVETKSKKKRYQLTERLYNIYYLMRRGQNNGRVKAVVQFMLQYYGKEHIHEAVADIANEACCMKAGQRNEHFLAIQILLSQKFLSTKLDNIIKRLPTNFLNLPDLPSKLKKIIHDKNYIQNLEIDEHYNYNIFNVKKEIKELKRLLKTSTENEYLYLSLAILTQMYSYKLENPEKYFKKALNMNKKNSLTWNLFGHFLLKEQKRIEEAKKCFKKALDLNPKDDNAWVELGTILSITHKESKRAVECFRNALDVNPQNTHALIKLGINLAFIFDENQEAEIIFKKVLDINPKSDFTWTNLGAIQLFHLNKYNEGLNALSEAAKLNPEDLDTSYIQSEIYTEDIPVSVLRDILSHTGHPAKLLNLFSCALMDKENYDELDTIEGWMRQAVEKKKDEPCYHGNLARVLALRGKVSESLRFVSSLLQHPEAVKKDIQKITDILAIAAAFDHGQEALDILSASPSLPELEPLAAGLKLYLGLDLRAPQEVQEIAEDIVKNINHWKKWHKNR